MYPTNLLRMRNSNIKRNLGTACNSRNTFCLDEDIFAEPVYMCMYYVLLTLIQHGRSKR